MMKKILGVSSSLRNKRFSYKNNLVADIKSINSLDELNIFIKNQIKITFKDIEKLSSNLNFEEKFKNLKKYKGNRGLSNSEAAIVYALWSAYQQKKVDIEYFSLSSIFESETPEKLNLFKKNFLKCDALLVSGPVYFGDRGSLTQRMIEYINTDIDCINHAKKILYSGLAVGAKRNGGQETTLIFQMLDFLNLGSKVVGNGYDTTAQYGGTLVSGDIGKLQEDSYGIKTALSTGKNLASMLKNTSFQKKSKLKSKKIHWCNIFVLQDNKNEECTKIVKSLVKNNENKSLKFRIFPVYKKNVHKCIACDLCPITEGQSENYRCIINNKEDFFKENHNEIIKCDSFIFAAYSATNFINIRSNYQQFIERTRYLRRDNYIFGNKLVTSLIVSEMNSNRNLHIRILTSLVRHLNILRKPIHIFKHGNAYMNFDTVVKEFKNFCSEAQKIKKTKEDKIYKPVGYEISLKKYLTTKVRG